MPNFLVTLLTGALGGAFVGLFSYFLGAVKGRKDGHVELLEQLISDLEGLQEHAVRYYTSPVTSETWGADGILIDSKMTRLGQGLERYRSVYGGKHFDPCLRIPMEAVHEAVTGGDFRTKRRVIENQAEKASKTIGIVIDHANHCKADKFSMNPLKRFGVDRPARN